MLFDQHQIATARAQLEQLHTTTVKHYRRTTSTTDTGSITTSWTLQGNINVRIETNMSQQATLVTTGESSTERIVYEYTVFSAHDTDIRTGDKLELASGIELIVEQASRAQSQALVGVWHCNETPGIE